MKQKEIQVKKGEPALNALLAVFCFVILPFVFIPSLQDQDLLPKLICVNLFSVLFGILLILKKEVGVFNRSTVLFFILIIFFIASNLFSSSKIINPEEGLFSILMYASVFFFIFLILSYKKFGSFDSQLKFLPITVLGIALMVAWNIMNNFSIEGNFLVNQNVRASLSNKNFVSESLFLLLPLVILSFFSENKVQKKYAKYSIAFILVLILVLKTISVWVALLVFVILFVPVYLLKIRKISIEKRKLFKWSGIGILLFVIAGILFFKSSKSIGVKEKVKQTFFYFNADYSQLIGRDDSANVNSTYERLLLWRNSVKLFEEDKLTGIGLSNWRMEYPKYGIGGAYHLNSGIMHFEHPHNEYLLFLSETGIISLIAFLSMIIFIIIVAWKNRNKIPKLTMYILLCGIISFLLVAFFAYPFHRPYSLLLFFLLFALILSKIEGEKSYKINRWFIVAIILLSSFSTYAIWRRFDGSMHMSKALNEQSHQRYGRMLKELYLATNDYFKIDNTGTPLDWYKGFAHHYSGTDSSLFYFLLAEKQNPYHLQTLSDIGAIYENEGIHDSAIVYCDKALAITPLFREAKINKVIAFFNTGKNEELQKEMSEVDWNLNNQNELNILKTILIKDLDANYRKNISEAELQKQNMILNDYWKTFHFFSYYKDSGKSLSGSFVEYCRNFK